MCTTLWFNWCLVVLCNLVSVFLRWLNYKDTTFFFLPVNSGSVTRVLLFNLTGERDPHNLLRPVMVCTQLDIVPSHVESQRGYWKHHTNVQTTLLCLVQMHPSWLCIVQCQKISNTPPPWKFSFWCCFAPPPPSPRKFQFRFILCFQNFDF